MTKKAADLVKGLFTVASMPAIYMRLTQVMNHPLSSAKDVAKVVSEDPGLTARLLRLVNSAFYGFPRRIDTVSRAITIIGTLQLRDLSLATSVVKMFDKVPQDLVSMDSFWCHSLACGVFARVIATQRREDNVERFFVAGLLHDLGSLVIYMKAPDQARLVLARCKETGNLIHKVEQEIMGFDHTDVGRALVESWNLPESLQEAVAFHHTPLRSSRYPVETSVVHVADIMAQAMLMGSSGEHLVPPLVSQAWDTLSLSPDHVTLILDDGERQFTDAVKIILSEEKK